MFCDGVVNGNTALLAATSPLLASALSPDTDLVLLPDLSTTTFQALAQTVVRSQ